jgi:hypothetical protein
VGKQFADEKDEATDGKTTDWIPKIDGSHGSYTLFRRRGFTAPPVYYEHFDRWSTPKAWKYQRKRDRHGDGKIGIGIRG